MEQMHVMAATMLQLRDNMLQPSLVLMFPVDAKGFFGKARSLFQKKMCVTFVCPMTKKPAKSGLNGLGYRVKVTKDWVKKAAPVLIIG